MKYIFLLPIILIGCATPNSEPVKSKSQIYKAELIGCVTHFLHENVSPKSSLGICKTVYKRWK